MMTTDRRLPALAAVLVAALATLLAGAAPAAAHAVLTATQPERGATVADSLDAVQLEFSEPVSFAQVQVTGPQDTRVDDGTPVEGGTAVEQALAPVLEQGVYQVAFRVTSDDGHPVEGTFEFTYEGPVGTGGQDDAPAGASDDPPLEDTAGDADVVEEEEVVDAPGALANEDARDVDLGMPVLIIGLLALVAFTGAALIASRRRRGRGEESHGAEGQG